MMILIISKLAGCKVGGILKIRGKKVLISEFGMLFGIPQNGALPSTIILCINVFFTIIFRACLQPYFILAIIGMTRNTLIKHKEDAVICEESGLVIANYNALITQP
jgi:hypothetical protein